MFHETFGLLLETVLNQATIMIQMYKVLVSEVLVRLFVCSK